MMEKLLSFGFAALLAASACANDISVSQAIDKTEVEFEGTVQFEIELIWQGSQSAYLFERPIRPDFEGLKIQRFSTSVSSTGSGESEVTTKKLSYTLVPTASGEGIIRPIEIDYISWPDSIPGQLLTDAMSVTIAEPRPTVPSGGVGWVTLAVAGGVGASVLAAVAITLVVAHRRKPRQIVISPRDQFLENLTELRSESGNDLKRFQTGLFKLLVAYLLARSGLDLAGLSSDEMAATLEQSNLTTAEKDKVIGWLARAEREKFSPAATAPGETVRLETEIREFFEKDVGLDT